MKNPENGYIFYEYRKKSEKEELSKTAWTTVYRLVNLILVVFLIFSLIWALFFRVVNVNGSSMSPALNDGDKILVSCFNYKPRKGDMVVFYVPSSDSLFVKRVIATENDTVDINYDMKTVKINGETINEPYAVVTESPRKNEIAYPFTTPEGHVFVMGDNRNESLDSRSVMVGGVDENRILGKAVFKLFPFSKDEIY